MSEFLFLGWPTQDRPMSFERASRVGRSHVSGAKLFRGEGHCVTIAPTGAGKGVSSIIPNLLLYNGPCIVVDPKGENCIVTARHRASMGNKVIVLDPFHGIDPLPDDINRGSINLTS